MNIHGVMLLFMIVAIVTVSFIIPWYANTVVADIHVLPGVKAMKIPHFELIDTGIPIIGGLITVISAPIAIIDFAIDYTGYLNDVFSQGAPGFSGSWLMTIWYLMIAVLASTTAYIVYTIIAGRTG